MRTVFLSHWNRRELQTVTNALEDLGYEVFTNLERITGSVDECAGWRMKRIEESDMFVFFSSPPGEKQLIRSIELGFAIGAEIPIAFVGKPRNTYQRYGDIFDDVDDLLTACYNAIDSAEEDENVAAL